MTESPIAPAALHARLEGLAAFSAPGPGVTRLVYDASWCAAHAWLREEAESAGLASTTDGLGNLLLHPRGFARGDRAILVGSHLDSVVNGGRYDGAFGVVAALALATLRRDASLPVVAFVTCEEEGSRFPAALTGVHGLLGTLAPSTLADLRDGDGVRWADALATARARGCSAPLPPEGSPLPRLVQPLAQLELHIEQGPVLERAGERLGVVDRIAGYRRFELSLAGRARHAGTTPMDARADALAAAAEIALAAETLARRAGPPAVATAGYVRAEPGLFNVVPGRALLGLEVRHVRPEPLAELAAAIIGEARAIAERRDVGFTLETRAAEPPAALDADLADRAEALARARGLPMRRMASGAGHDTMAFAAAGVPSLMLFAPSRDGISHSPDEHTDLADLAAVTAFAHDVLGEWVERFR